MTLKIKILRKNCKASIINHRKKFCTLFLFLDGHALKAVRCGECDQEFKVLVEKSYLSKSCRIFDVEKPYKSILSKCLLFRSILDFF